MKGFAMKSLAVIILLAGYVFSQSLPTKDKPILLVSQNVEKCYECPNRFLMICSTDPDCNVPPKQVLYYHWYETVDAALADAEKQNWDVVWIAVTRPISFTAETTEEHEKQPDKIIRKRNYKLVTP